MKTHSVPVRLAAQVQEGDSVTWRVDLLVASLVAERGRLLLECEALRVENERLSRRAAGCACREGLLSHAIT